MATAETGTCTFCGEHPELDRYGGHEVDFMGCCLAAREALAEGWSEAARHCGGGSWSRESRPREDSAPTCRKVRWYKVVNKKLRPDVPVGCQMSLLEA